jgi:HSP20 family protein
MVGLKALLPWRSDKPQVPAREEDLRDPFNAFRREVNRLFDDFFDGFGGRSLRAQFGLWSDATPTMDFVETEKEIVVTAELPDLNEKDFEVTMAGDLLTIKGEKRAEHEERNGGATYTERRFGAFSRSVRLPFEVGDEKVEATYDKGVLTVRVAKPPELQRAARRIEVKSV